MFDLGGSCCFTSLAGVKFTFTNIDPKRPTREFSFTVHYGNDIYTREYTHFVLKPNIDYILVFTKSLVTRSVFNLSSLIISSGLQLAIG